MEFKRINKDTVTCIITEDDMFEQGIRLEDLFEKKKEAMDFLQDVMRKAKEEVDYNPNGSFMPLQITVLPDHSISITLSENSSTSFSEILKNLTEKAGIQIPKKVLEDIGESGDDERLGRLNDYLKTLKQFTNQVKDIVENKVSLNENETTSSARDKIEKISNKAVKPHNTPDKNKEASKKQDENRLKFHEYVFKFTDLSTVISFCHKVPSDLKIESALYKSDSDNMYYMDIVRNNEDPKRFAALFTMAYEFGHFQASNRNTIAYIRENYDCLIEKDAVSHLSNM